MMKKRLYIIFFLWIILLADHTGLYGQDRTSLIDSLDCLLRDSSVSRKQKIDILLALIDLTESENADRNLTYSLQAFELSQELKDPFALSIALSSIIIRNVKSNVIEKFDSLITYYLPASRQTFEGSDSEGLDVVLETFVDDSRISLYPDVGRRLMESRTVREKYEKRLDSPDLYQRGVSLYMIGRTRSIEATLRNENNASSSQIALFEQAAKMADCFPINARRMFSVVLFNLSVDAYAQMNEYHKIVRLTDEYKKVLDDYFAQQEMKRRQYLYSENLYIRLYDVKLSALLHINPPEAYKLYKEYKKYVFSATGDELRRNKVFFYGMSHKIMENNDSKEALASCDSLISMIERGEAEFYRSIVKTYVARARILAKMGRYKESYYAYLKAKDVSDAKYQTEYNNRLGQMRQQNGIDKLEMSKIQNLQQNKRFENIISVVILFVIILVALYLLWSLYKTRRINKTLLKNIEEVKRNEEDKIKFINSINHEVRTPLNVVVGFSFLMVDDSIDYNEKLEYRRIIENGRKSLNELFVNLLDTANINRMLEELPMELTDVNEICRKEMELLRYNNGKEKVQYLLDLMEDEEHSLNTNRQYLSILIRELLNNANKFTESGMIELQCRRNTAGDAIEFSVSDTGCGIPEDKRDIVFDHFTKLNEFTPGCGNGLYLSKLIVKKHGGTIAIDKNYTIGLRIVFSIPISPPPPLQLRNIMKKRIL